MKRILCFVLILSVLLTVPALAAETERRAVIAADLDVQQIGQVYESFGLTRGSVPELTITNDIERSYLEGLVPDEQLGTRSISCVLVTAVEGENQVYAENVDWCTESMYLSAMATAGIEHVSIHVTAPFAVSGTAALAGVYLAYEDMTGEPLGEAEKKAGILDLVTTGELARELGGDEALTLVTELKLILDEIQDMSDGAVTEKIEELAREYKIPLNDYQKEKLLELCRSLEKLDTDALKDKVQTVKDTLKKMGEFKDKAVSFWDALLNFFRAIGEFIAQITAIFN